MSKNTPDYPLDRTQNSKVQSQFLSQKTEIFDTYADDRTSNKTY